MRKQRYWYVTVTRSSMLRVTAMWTSALQTTDVI